MGVAGIAYVLVRLTCPVEALHVEARQVLPTVKRHRSLVLGDAIRYKSTVGRIVWRSKLCSRR